jgi:hypothetical protein
MGHRCEQSVSSDLFFPSASDQRRNGLARGLSRCRPALALCRLHADFSCSYRRGPSVIELPFFDVFKVGLSRGNLRVVQLRFHRLRPLRGAYSLTMSGTAMIDARREATDRAAGNIRERISEDWDPSALPVVKEGGTGMIPIPRRLAGSKMAGSKKPRICCGNSCCRGAEPIGKARRCAWRRK